MIVVNFNKKYRKVTEKEGVYVTGYCFINDTMISDEQFLNDLENISEISQFENKLNQYNGFYAFVINRDNECFAAVDRIRSIPIFYGKKDGNFYVSNDAEWVRQQIVDTELEPIVEQEFLLTGFVTGQDTLYENIKQLQAGECLYINIDRNEFVTNRYYRFLHEEPDRVSSKGEYQKELDVIMNKVIERLVSHANGRQIVIPLSAGLDSRLIALKLKQHEYKNVLCFSYGIKGNFEAEISKMVADLLCFPWAYIEYTEELHKEWFNSLERKIYYDMSCNWTSLPVTQDWPAVWELKKYGLLEQGAVFVPGHSGDFPAGSHIPSDAYPRKKATKEDLFFAVKNIHYSLLQWQEKTKKDNIFWKNRILKTCEVNHIFNGYEYAAAFEKWDWQERQAKFIVNSVRVYEFWGYDWWLPFWDKDFMYYWQEMPLQYRKGKLIYDEYVDLLYKSITGKDGINKVKQNKTNRKNIFVVYFLKRINFYYSIKNILVFIQRKRKNHFDNTNMSIWRFENDFLLKNKHRVNHANGFSVIDLIEDLKMKNKK